MNVFEGVTFFLRLAGRLKRERRRGWIEKVGVEAPESVADHTFRTALISMVIGDLKGLDTCRMMRIALIHDLAEAVIGDITSEGVKMAEGKWMMNDRGMDEILSHLPDPLQKMYHALWQDWLEAGSIEAKMVQEIDKLEMALQASEYRDEGYSVERLEEFRRSALEKIKDKDLIKLLRFSAQPSRKNRI